MNILKSAGKGLLYILLSPLILAFFCLYAVYCILMFFVEWIIAIIQFFKGGKFSLRTKEDDQLDQLIAQKQSEKNQETQVASQTTNNTTNQTINNIYVDPNVFAALNKMNNQNPNQTINTITNQNVESLENVNTQIEMQDSTGQQSENIIEVNSSEEDQKND